MHPAGSERAHKNTSIPLLETDIELAIPNVEVRPSIEELQTLINDCAR